MLIAHFLGVDHVGHTFGPNHTTMTTKLKQMDKILRDLIESLGLASSALSCLQWSMLIPMCT